MSREGSFDFQVTGRVQGVGFRAFVQTTGQQLGLTGWVKNQLDGSVVGHVEGDVGLVTDFLKLIHIGNRWSSVTAMNSHPAEVSSQWANFEIRY